MSGGAHLVLHARLRHAPAASTSTTYALKMVPLHEIRQIQREVRAYQRGYCRWRDAHNAWLLGTLLYEPHSPAVVYRS